MFHLFIILFCSFILFLDVFSLRFNTHGDIQEFLDYKIDNGRLDGKGGLSYKTVKDMLNIIKLSMMYAIEKNYIKNINLNFKINLTQDKCW